MQFKLLWFNSGLKCIEAKGVSQSCAVLFEPSNKRAISSLHASVIFSFIGAIEKLIHFLGSNCFPACPFIFLSTQYNLLLRLKNNYKKLSLLSFNLLILCCSINLYIRTWSLQGLITHVRFNKIFYKVNIFVDWVGVFEAMRCFFWAWLLHEVCQNRRKK